MPTVFDDIETPFLDGENSNGLKPALKLAFRGDFCVGYFNLRAWHSIDEVVNGWQMPTTAEAPPPARLLVGMQRMPHDPLRSWLSESPEKAPEDGELSADSVVRLFRTTTAFLTALATSGLDPQISYF